MTKLERRVQIALGTLEKKQWIVAIRNKKTRVFLLILPFIRAYDRNGAIRAAVKVLRDDPDLLRPPNSVEYIENQLKRKIYCWNVLQYIEE